MPHDPLQTNSPAFRSMTLRAGTLALLVGFFTEPVYPQNALSPHGQAYAGQPPHAQRPTAAGANTNTTRNNQSPITPRREVPTADRLPRTSHDPFSLWKFVGAMTIALAGIVGAAKLFKSWGPFHPIKPLSGSVFQVLGLATLPPRHQLYLVRLGQKMILVGSTGDHLTNLTEITDPQEVASLAHLCQADADSSSETISVFTRMLNQVKPLSNPRESSPLEESTAREELEARLKTFAQS